MNRTARRRSPAVQMLLATILSLGALAAWVIAWGTASILYIEFAFRGYNFESLVFTVEGQPLLLSYSPARVTYSDYMAYRTLDGRKIDDPDSLQLSDARSDELPPGASFEFPSDDWQWRIRSQLEKRPAPVAWYLIHDAKRDGHAWFVGFQPQSKQRIGYLGRSGFRPDLPPVADQFALPISLFNFGGIAPTMTVGTTVPTPRSETSKLYIVSDGSLMQVDLARQTVNPLNLPDKVVSVGTFDEWTKFTDRLLVRLPGELHILTLAGEPLRVIPLPPEARQDYVSLVGTTSDEVILIANDEPDGATPEVSWIDAAGEVTRRQQVKLYRPEPTDPRMSASIVTAAVPAPTLVLIGMTLDAASNQKGFAARFAHLASAGWPPFVVLLIVSSIAAAVAYRHQRAVSGGGAVVWAIFVLLLGPPGLVGYWTHRRWPAVAACEHCGVRVPRDRQACPACGAEFPQPAALGIEMFA